MKLSLLLAAALLPLTCAAHIPASATYVTENQNGGTMAMYTDSRCFSTLGIYSESPMQGVTSRGCVTDMGDSSFSVRWDNGNETDLPYAGWRKVSGL